MKLLRVKILGDNFRSLRANIDYIFNHTFTEKKLSTKVFAGLNGSGKSNFLELIAEIFYYLERYHIDSTPKEYINNSNFGFEIEYLLPISKLPNGIAEFKFKKACHVRIIKRIVEKGDELSPIEFSYCEYGEKDFIRRDYNTSDLLPNKIIAYTSGQNELLSNPFIRLRYHYFKDLQKQSNSILDRRMYFIDEESNYSIFVANMLLGNPKPLKYIKDLFSIDDIYSFRISINYKHNTKEAISIFQNKLPLVNNLKSCASTWVEDSKKKTIVLDFIINEATHQAFQYHYKSAFTLFQTLYELQSLNLIIEKQETKKFVINAAKVLNVSDELSKPDPSDLVFRIEKIRIKKTSDENDKSKPIYYKSLSDGEHQLNEIIGSVMMMENDGCLFLLDEPDTHFNPKWRAKMITMLNQVSGNDYDYIGKPVSIRQHEIIMTTHSPFIISDSHKDDVYKFDKKNEKLIAPPDYETYGSSVGFVLETIFERDLTISDYSNEDLTDLKASINSLDDLRRVKKELLKFGESIEKFDAYNYLMIKEKELKLEKDAN